MIRILSFKQSLIDFISHIFFEPGIDNAIALSLRRTLARSEQLSTVDRRLSTQEQIAQVSDTTGDAISTTADQQNIIVLIKR